MRCNGCYKRLRGDVARHITHHCPAHKLKRVRCYLCKKYTNKQKEVHVHCVKNVRKDLIKMREEVREYQLNAGLSFYLIKRLSTEG